MPKSDDSQVVAGALAGSEEAYRELVVRYQRPVYTLILRMVRNPAVAEELSQETFVRAFRRLDTYDPAKKLSSWLFKIAHNATLDHLRRRRVETVSLDGAAEGDRDYGERLPDESTRTPEEELARKGLGQVLELAVGRLRPEYREVILLRFGEGLSYQEIAEVTELPLGTVKTHIHRARKDLAAILQDLGWVP